MSDDRNIGAFRHRPALRVVESEVAPLELLEVAKAALRSGRLPWAHAEPARRRNAERQDDPEPTRRKSAAQTLASLLGVPWPQHLTRRWRRAVAITASLVLVVVALRVAVQFVLFPAAAAGQRHAESRVPSRITATRLFATPSTPLASWCRAST